MKTRLYGYFWIFFPVDLQALIGDINIKGLRSLYDNMEMSSTNAIMGHVSKQISK